MSWTLCTSGSAIIKGGKHADEDIVSSGAILASWSDEAEGYIEAQCRRSYVANYADLDTAIQRILSDVCSSQISKQIINWNMDGYTSKQEVTTMLDVQDDIVQRGINLLKDFKSGSIKTP